MYIRTIHAIRKRQNNKNGGKKSKNLKILTNEKIWTEKNIIGQKSV